MAYPCDIAWIAEKKSKKPGARPSQGAPAVWNVRRFMRSEASGVWVSSSESFFGGHRNKTAGVPVGFSPPHFLLVLYSQFCVLIN